MSPLTLKDLYVLQEALTVAKNTAERVLGDHPELHSLAYACERYDNTAQVIEDQILAN